MNKVAGIVILYNPDINVYDNIETYLNQVDHLFIFDNSTKPDNEIKILLSKCNNCTFVSENKNLGVGYALNFGAGLAMEKGFQYLLTMDQDSTATPGMINLLLQAIENNKDIAIATPVHTNKFNTQTIGGEKYQEIMFDKTSGNLVSLEKYKQIGAFKNNYFIDYIDVEYGLRIKKNNLKVLKVSDAVLIHNEADISRKRILWFYVYPMNHDPERLFYKTRNLCYLRDEYKKLFPDFIKNEIIYFIKLIAKILLFERQKKLKMKMVIKGYREYLNGFKGNIN
jgi:rhamnosyltransferase